MGVGEIAARLADSDRCARSAALPGRPAASQHRRHDPMVVRSADCPAGPAARTARRVHRPLHRGQRPIARATRRGGDRRCRPRRARQRLPRGGRRPATPTTRYRLLDTVRRFALEQLRRRDELEHVYDRFVDHVLASVQRIVAGASATWRPDAGHRPRRRASTTSPKRCAGASPTTWTRTVRTGCAVCCGQSSIRATPTTSPTSHAERSSAGPPTDRSRAAQVAAVRATAEYVTGHPDRAIADRDLDDGADLRRGASVRSLCTGCSARLAVRSAICRARSKHSEPARRSGHEFGMTAMALELDIAAALVAGDLGDVEQSDRRAARA